MAGLFERIPTLRIVPPIELPRLAPRHRKAINTVANQPSVERRIPSKHPGASNRSKVAPTSPEISCF
jgi:hypothetical protein